MHAHQDHRWKSDNPQAETYVVQKYVDKPLLIGCKKFDLRIFVLATTFPAKPLATLMPHQLGWEPSFGELLPLPDGICVSAWMQVTNYAPLTVYLHRGGVPWPHLTLSRICGA